MVIYLIRHGETEWNTKRLLQGTTNIPLNQNGIQVAHLTAEGLKDVPFDMIYTSPLQRARKTAEIIRGDRQIPLYEEERLKEISFGPFEGLCCSEEGYNIPDPQFVNFFRNPGAYAPPEGGESILHLCERTGEFLMELVNRPDYQNKTILISAHGAVVKALLHSATNGKLQDFWNGGVHKNCGVSILDVKDGVITLRQENVLYYDETKKRLLELADPKYRDFQRKLLPGTENILGVRVPKLRKLAGEIAKGDWEAFLRENNREWYENDMLQGMVIGCARMDFGRRLELIQSFIPRIDNWCVCDVFCSSLKETKKHREQVWDFLQPYLASEGEYELRFAVVMLLDYFVEEDYLERTFAAFDGITSDAYYARMAVAWAVSVFYVHFPEETLAYLKNNRLDKWTYRKTLQKIVESDRVDGETKEMIRRMKSAE